ncbi:hypothetical protein BaRGS_00017440 [Batillaria attramentaria]|uniref:Uncharacterized protein n=1 Tax=Batillaria attramentaria TaxID=370345 RepID=A0ABD0KVT7_9CAEN
MGLLTVKKNPSAKLEGPYTCRQLQYSGRHCHRTRDIMIWSSVVLSAASDHRWTSQGKVGTFVEELGQGDLQSPDAVTLLTIERWTNAEVSLEGDWMSDKSGSGRVSVRLT